MASCALPMLNLRHRFCFFTLLAAACVVPASVGVAQVETVGAKIFPNGIEPVSASNFEALMASSPFLRSLDLSESLILTGIAKIEGNFFVTLFRRDTKETHIVSDAINPEGMRLVGMNGNQNDLETITAQISLASGEVFSVRFDEGQLKPGEGKPASGSKGGGTSGSSNGAPPVSDYRQGISGDGFRGPPPPELVAKLSKLTEERRNQLIQQIRDLRDKNRELSSEDRQVIFTKMVDRALTERR
ncbi:MAG: hypothetical protein KDL87_13255 [Verrucomicrobiae bacterium]|nr:hypothetical protein [Verrucomicrobiae bacterium]